MTKITEVYTKEIYRPFLNFCEKKGFVFMEDLANCPFQYLPDLPGFTSLLASRIHTVYLTYCKNNGGAPAPSAARPAAPAVRTRTAASPVTTTRAAAPARSRSAVVNEVQLADFLENYFKENQDRLITTAEAAKAAGPRGKRTDVTRILTEAAWCQQVDKGVFYYLANAK